MMIKRILAQIIWILFISVGLISCTDSSRQGPEDERPNILLLVADDLGYADLGCYGGDIETPHIDQLAANGIRFSRFHTSPKCAPTRAMLLSGNDNHIAGMGKQSLTTTEFGYEGRLTDRVVPIPAILKDAGYHTYMAGKWHLGKTPEANPHRKGFEHSFVLLDGAGNHYNDQGLFEGSPVSPYTEDGKPAKWTEGTYSTDFYTDKIIKYIDHSQKDQKPFFVFAAYTSPHWPLQVEEKFWAKYKGRYDGGYEKLKERRLESLKQAGLIPGNAVLPPNHESVKPWDSLSEEEKKKESRKMEIYAGMVDNLDHNIGLIINHLVEIGELDNTFILFMSDNGAASEDFYYHEHYGPFIREHFSDDYGQMGQPYSFISYGPQWAEAGSAPFRYFKTYTTEGGMIAPMIISAPGLEQKNEIHHGFVTLMDIAPTFYELAQTEYPKANGKTALYPLRGRSLIPLTSGKVDKVHPSDYVFALEHGNRAMVRKGDWKITSIQHPFEPENFQLYNLSTDLAELHDLRDAEPDKYKELLEEWTIFSTGIKVQVPTPASE